jgi:hypothetical protein
MPVCEQRPTAAAPRLRAGPWQARRRGAMAAAGITAQALAETMKAGLSASYRDGSPDFIARHKYLETALRVGGFEPANALTVEETYEERIIRIRGRACSQ